MINNEIYDDSSTTTVLHPCTVDTLSHFSFCCGSYELDEATSHRNGRFDIYDNNCQLIKSYPMTHGILDVKVILEEKARDQTQICISDSSGTLSLFNLINEPAMLDSSDFDNRSMKLITSVDCDHGLALSTDYSCNKFVTSYQDGSITLNQLTSTGFEILETKENTHVMMHETQPVWFVAFKKQYFKSHDHSNTSNTSQSLSSEFLSGGDDCVLRLWDFRLGLKSGPVTVVKNCHDAGVTSAQWHPTIEHIVTTGSYDEHLRIFDERYWKKPIIDIHTGGGVWRLKWKVNSDSQHSERTGIHSYLGLACMQSGAKVYTFSNDCSILNESLSIESSHTKSIKVHPNYYSHKGVQGNNHEKLLCYVYNRGIFDVNQIDSDNNIVGYALGQHVLFKELQKRYIGNIKCR